MFHPQNWMNHNDRFNIVTMRLVQCEKRGYHQTIVMLQIRWDKQPRKTNFFDELPRHTIFGNFCM